MLKTANKRRRESLVAQVLAVNLLLVTSSLLAITLASGLDLADQAARLRFSLLVAVILLALLVSIFQLRRRFSPLEDLIRRVESVDPARPAEFEAPPTAVDEVARLSVSFAAVLERIEEERRRSGGLVLRAQEEERKRVARDLHDEVNQALTAILLRLEALAHEAPPGMREELAELKALANQAMEELLQLARQLRPPVLDDHGLAAAVETMASRFSGQTGIEVDLSARGDFSTLSDDRQTAAYRVVQEALSNVARHAGAERAEVELKRGETGLSLTVRDDGRGFDPRQATGRLGISGMRERARLAGGSLEVDSHPGGGTAISLTLPEVAPC